MKAKAVQNTPECIDACEAAFTRCTARKPSGCVEPLRLCRENCAAQPPPA